MKCIPAQLVLRPDSLCQGLSVWTVSILNNRLITRLSYVSLKSFYAEVQLTHDALHLQTTGSRSYSAPNRLLRLAPNRLVMILIRVIQTGNETSTVFTSHLV